MFFSYPVTVLIAVTAIVVAIIDLKQSVAYYYDFVGVMVVIAGTIAVSVATLPWKHFSEMMEGFKQLLAPRYPDTKQIASDALNLVRGNQEGFQTTGLPLEVLKDGVELLQLGLKTEEIENILRERMFQYLDIRSGIANSIRSLAKYPPAFGLLGTVLGLVSLMRAVSAGAGSEEVGVRMAVALVATLYGIVTANVLVNPAGEALSKYAANEAKAAEIALQGVLLASDQTSILVAQEALNSYLPRGSRLSVVGGGGGTSAKEAA
ncbi:MAG: MotA/TolQ/ExbB proton channel family protein [Bdellovibrionales bacterium]|nr:MotA/TolQ/ExbB proton channel family protein [Bdellovibrionales bacterium]